ncbi:MAG: heavy-metal-associated domain-containing protein [Clostridium sp.]|uniref:heavy-metal-associated domain-containing protein n=1 Tax=Clostridium sp. DSM 8431 TaxID=1761781 RepID=UPI0008E5008F|nr:heavy metal-associated domain-containing protein [Clostridium sp. DSM 8431]MCR4944495.1 heavy-metal-associated domain-containing protein [Clostridium sp.]SFU50741.1 copper chaperone [Clostridium sp. DSM 8431]
MKKVISIEGMSCENCVRHVTEALEAIEGVSSVVVSLDDNTATVETEVDNEILKNAIEDEGYDVTDIK